MKLAKLTMMSYEDTVERLKNEPFRIVTPLRSRRSIERLRKRQDEASQKETKKKE
jgi:hypothetical protein